METDYMNEIFKVLHKSNQFNKIHQALDKYLANILEFGPERKSAPIIMQFKFNYNDLLITSSTFLDILVLEPTLCLSLLNKNIWLFANNVIMSNMGERQPIQLSQLHCTIRFSGLPAGEENKFKFIPFVHPVPLWLTQMHCVLIAYGEHCKYVRQSIWYCSRKCARNTHRIIANQNLNHENIEKCSHCMGDMKEDTMLRTTSDYCLIQVVAAQALQTPIKVGRISRAVTVKLMDELCDNEMKLGGEYMLIGWYSPMTKLYNSWNFSTYLPSMAQQQ